MSTGVILAGLLIGGAGSAQAATAARFLPDETYAGWDGAVATVVFKEVDVAVDGATTISVSVTAAVEAACKRGESTLTIRRSASALQTDDYPVRNDGTVTGVAEVPLVVTGLKVSGYTCTIRSSSLTTVLEDFWTGATLTHTS